MKQAARVAESCYACAKFRRKNYRKTQVQRPGDGEYWGEGDGDK